MKRALSCYTLTGLNGDYQRVRMDLVFGPSSAQHIVDIFINDDNLLESNETFVLELILIAPIATVMLNPNVLTFTIVDNDSE